MTDLSVRETAARAYTEHLIGWAMADDEWEAARSSTEVAAMGAALAAVAPRLADVLRKHALDDFFFGFRCRCGKNMTGHLEHTDHLADVVRAWLLT